MPDALAKLRRLDDAASPGPLRVSGNTVLSQSGDHIIHAYGGQDDGESDAQRAALAHLLRPAFEALEKPERCLRQPDDETCLGMSEANQRWSGLCDRCAVFAQLEEALGRLC